MRKGGKSARYVAPDLSYTTGREGESSARIINGMKKQNKKLESSPVFFWGGETKRCDPMINPMYLGIQHKPY